MPDADDRAAAAANGPAAGLAPGLTAGLTTGLTAGLVARAHRATEPLHSLIYFVPEADQQLTAVGLRPGRMGYFASRSAAMGAVSAAVTTATFYNFNPALVAKYIPQAWTLASPAAILEARLAAVDQAYQRLLGADVLASAELRELQELTRVAAADLDPAGRPLYAAHAELDWPSEPPLALWHGITLLREYRGDGHLAALLDAGLSGIDAILTHTATGRGFTEPAAKRLRGWSDEQWAAATDGLRERGLWDDAGLSAAGVALRAQVEAATDRLATAPYAALGEEQTARLTELGKALSRIAVSNGAFPDNVFASAR